MSQANNAGETCRQVEEQIAELCEGTAPEWVLEHVAECDRCRDLRYEAERICAELADAGADFVVPADLEARLRAAMAGLETSGEVAMAPVGPVPAGATELAEPMQLSAATTEEPKVEAPKAEMPKVEEPKAEEPKAEEPKADVKTAEMPKVEEPKAAGWEAVQQLEQERQRREAEAKRAAEGKPAATEAAAVTGAAAGAAADAAAVTGAAAGAVADAGAEANVAAGAAAGAGAAKSAGGAKVVSLVERLRRPRNAGLLALVCAAAAAAIVAVAVRHPSGDPGAMASAQGWQGKVVRVNRAAGGSGGLELCDSAGERCRVAEAETRIELGAVLRTDERTRAYVELDDGTRLALDRSTRLGMLQADERAARLESGAIVVDVAKIEGAGAHIELPSGRLDVLGTKFALRALGQSVAVDVSRGLVRLSDREGRNVTVRAGEEGRMYPGMAPYASGAPALGEAMSWSESEADRAGTESAVRGLGELRAKKPGAADEQKGAVQLTSHQVKTRIVDGFARTEVEEVFTNTTNEVLEGIYRFPMPPDAQIERLALEVDGHYEEGAFVDRDRAAAIWRGAIVQAGAKKPIQEEIIWVPGPWKDPALLEWQRGGRFELRIYPIPRQGSRKVVLAYTQVVAPVGRVMRYVYPLGHDPSGALKVADFGVDVQLRGHDRSFGVSTQGYVLGAGEPAASGADAERLTMKTRDFVPSGDLVVEYALPTSESELTAWAYQWTGASEPAAASPASPAGAASGSTTGSGSGNSAAPVSVAGVDMGGAPYVVMALRPRLPRATEQLERAFVLLVDASRSMVGERYRRASELAVRLVEELDRLDRFTVLACDTSCRPLPGGLRYPGHQSAKEVESFLAGITPEGGSDLGAQLREARAAASSAEGRAVRVIYLGDGTPTVGAIRPRYLERGVREALPGADASLTAVAIGTDADLDALGAMARAGGGVVLPYVPGQRLGEAAYAILGASYGMGLREARLEMPTGLVEVAPTKLDTIPAGGQALVVARMTQPELRGTVVLRGKVGQESFEQRYPLAVAATTAAGNAFVPRLYAALRIADLERQGDAAARTSAIALSQRFNVASRYTSLLVLESAAMFKAFGLDNTRYAPSWTGEEATQSSEAEGELDVPGADEKDDAFGEGTGSGYAAGGRAGPSDSKAKAPRSEAQWGPDSASAASPAPAATSTSPWASPPAPPPGQAPAAKRAIDAEEPAMDRRERSRRPSGNFVPMRRIWERMGSVNTAQLVPPKASAQRLGEVESRVRGDENRRDAVKELYVLRLLAGQIDGARETAERWSARDALDPDALVARADVAASSGQRDEAIRILGSVVDVRPGDVPSQQRLARLHRWAGRGAVGCRHSLALAQLREKDGKLLADAVWCARQNGEGAWAEEMLSAADNDTRQAAERELGKLAGAKDELRGELRLEANWQGGADVDLALLHPEGHRVSWLGAPTKGLISATDVASSSHEALALLGSDAGDYVIEVTRASGEGPVSGTVSVTVPGAGRRDISFSLAAGEKRKALGLVNVRWQSRLVPL